MTIPIEISVCVVISASLFFLLFADLVKERINYKKTLVNQAQQAYAQNTKDYLFSSLDKKNLQKLSSFTVSRHLPFYLDMLALCLEAGLNLPNALKLTVSKAPPGDLRKVFEQVLFDIRTGQPWSSAWQNMAKKYPLTEVHQLTTLLIQAEQLGLALVTILHTQADQCRQLYLAQAEKKALEAPIKMLIPLILFIFPCSFIILAFPISYQLLGIWQ